MPTVLVVRASRAPFNAPDAAVGPFNAELTVVGPTFGESIARLSFNEEVAFEAEAPAAMALCSRAIGRPAREWPRLAADLDIEMNAELAEEAGTTEQNAAKAIFMCVQWLEPHLARDEAPDVAAELRGNLIVDYRGEPGVQRHIYFVDRALAPQIADRLFRLRLLCEFQVTIGQGPGASLWFVPLVAPGVGVHRFDPGAPQGGPVYRAWQQIRSDMGRRIDLFLRR